MADLNGTWLGTYWQRGNPTRFEIVLLQSGNSISGSILDDNYLGEARLSGEVVGRRLSFSKRYVASSPDSVDYVGTISEDEDYIQGQWRIGNAETGPWEARRSGESLSLSTDYKIEQNKIEQNKTEQKVPLAVGFR